MIKKNTVITFDVKGSTGLLPRTQNSVRQAAIDSLTPFFTVQALSVTAASFLSDPVHALTEWPYTATARVQVLADYADIRDLDSVIAHAFYDAAGRLPTVTAQRYEQGQADATPTSGLSLSTALVLGVVAIVGLAVVTVAK